MPRGDERDGAAGGGRPTTDIPYAELRKAAARGSLPSWWASADGPHPPPCTADRHHHWSEERADGALRLKLGMESVDVCSACKMIRIRLPGCGGTAYAPRIEHAIWDVAYRAREYALARDRKAWSVPPAATPPGIGIGGMGGR